MIDMTIKAVRTTLLSVPWPDTPWLKGHAFGNARTLRETGRIVRRRTGVEVGESEIRIEGEPRLYRSPSFLDPPEMSQRRGKEEVNERGDIPVGLDRSPVPAGSSFVGRKI